MVYRTNCCKRWKLFIPKSQHTVEDKGQCNKCVCCFNRIQILEKERERERAKKKSQQKFLNKHQNIWRLILHRKFSAKNYKILLSLIIQGNQYFSGTSKSYVLLPAIHTRQHQDLELGTIHAFKCHTESSNFKGYSHDRWGLL